MLLVTHAANVLFHGHRNGNNRRENRSVSPPRFNYSDFFTQFMTKFQGIGLKDVLAEVFVFDDVADLLQHILPVNGDASRGYVVRDRVEQFLKHG